MANVALLDIDMSAVNFAAVHAELLTLKLDNPRTRAGADSKLRAIAEWANYVDDCALAFQSRLYDHEVAIAALEAVAAAVPLAGHTARSVVGRAANSSGVAADIAGNGTSTAPAVPVDNGTTVAFRQLTLSDMGDGTILDIDAAAESTLSWRGAGDGARTFGGLSWSTVNVAAADAFGLVASTGLQFDATTSSTAYTTSARTCPYLRIPITTAIPNFDPLGTYVLEAYFSSLTLGTSANRIVLGIDLDVAGTDRMLCGGRRNTSGTQQIYSTIDAAGTINGDTSSADCVAVRINAHGVSSYGGASSGGTFPSRYTKSGGIMGAVDSYCSVMDDNAFVVIAFAPNEAGGAMAATLRRFRIRRIRG
jgi:hypothetical protein